MNSYRHWSTIAATIALSAGTVLLPGVAQAETSTLGSNITTTDVKFAVSCHTAIGQYDPFRTKGSGVHTGTSDWGVKIAAPESVPAGQDFTYTITPDKAIMNFFDPTDKLQDPWWIRMKYDIAIPPEVTFEKA
ncbi:hypothetical protein, partial [Rhodococcus marinonascens]|uniref:hypothetical protein n=1 Tax=Rhodococcus marinonascens TaxID=38311 RepID=UPI000AE250D1